MHTKILTMLNLSEDLYNRKETSKTALQLITRYWLTAHIVPEKKQHYLQKAYHISVAMYNKDVANVTLYIAVIFMDYKLKNYITAREALDRLNNSRSYFKSNNPKVFHTMLYIGALMDYVEDKRRSVVKAFRQLEGAYEDNHDSTTALYLASLSKKVYGNNEVAFKFFLSAYESGNRSAFMYVLLHEFFIIHPAVTGIQKLLLPFLSWAVEHDVDVSEIVSHYGNTLRISELRFGGYDRLLIKLNEYCGHEEWMLVLLCEMGIRKNERSACFLTAYEKGYEAGIAVEGLDYQYIKAAYENGLEKIPIKLLQKYLDEASRVNTSVTDEIKCYLYHLLISNDEKELCAKYDDDIMDFGAKEFTARKNGKYYVTLYIHMLERFQYDTGLCKAVSEMVFAHELVISEDYDKVNQIKHVWVCEKEKKGISVYPVVDGRAVIQGVSEDYELFFLGQRQVNIIKAPPHKLKKVVMNPELSMVKKLYLKGFVSIDIMIWLCSSYMRLGYLPKDALALMTQVLTLTGISEYYRAVVSLALGNYYELENKQEQAYMYYSAVSEQYMSQENIQDAIRIYLNAGETKKAHGLLSRHKNVITDKIYFYALKSIIKKSEYRKVSANFAYELLMKASYDKEFLEIVLSYYSGSLREWILLVNKLNMMGIEVTACYETIIKKGILMYKSDEGLQKTFQVLYDKSPDNKWVERFVYYACSQIISGYKFILAYDTVKVFEKIFLQDTENKLLSYALTLVYFNQSIETVNTDHILRSAMASLEEDGIMLWPIKKYQDKNFTSSYMEKNVPFIYKSLPRKEVYLYHKEGNEEAYSKLKMRYFRFGLYVAVLPVFYGEEITYFYEEDGIRTEKEVYKHDRIRFVEQYDDLYYKINNALIYSQMFKFDAVEEIIEHRIRNKKELNLQIL